MSRPGRLATTLTSVAGLLVLAGATAYDSTYYAAKSVKVVFAKRHFYNNTVPYNSVGCAGDAKEYFDPTNDRVAPVKPTWLKNVSLDITNANSPYGASNSIFCSYGSASSSLPAACQGPLPPASCNVPPPPSNCAAFDDRQSLTGYQARAYIIGGMACEDADCNTQSNTIYAVDVNETTNLSTPSSAVSISKLSITMPSASIFGAWSFDEIHDWVIGYGGGNSGGGAFFSIQRLLQKPFPGSTADPSILAIENNTGTTTLNHQYAGQAGLTSAEITAEQTAADTVTTLSNAKSRPGARVGHSLTYVSRRAPGLGRRKLLTGAANCGGGTYTSCLSQSVPSSTLADTGWNDDDYFVSIGGIAVGSGNNYLAGEVMALNPHRFANPDGTGTSGGQNVFDWEWLSNANWLANTVQTTPVNTMPVIDLSTDGTVPTSWVHTDRFGRTNTVTGDSATNYGIFPPRAYHRSVYDPIRDRIYVFGGITTMSPDGTVNGGNSGDAITNFHQSYWSLITGDSYMTPTSETWIYDTPGVGKRPTLGCRITTSPIGGNTLPRFSTATIPDHSTFDAAILNYEQSSAVFPPGGCMQYAQPVTDTVESDTEADDGGTAPNYTQPDMRFEHAMAFDERQGVVIMFGGCNTKPSYDAANGLQGSTTIAAGSYTSVYDPTKNCDTRAEFLNDTWMFIPPESPESALAYSLSGSTNYTFGRPDFISPLDPATNGLPYVFPISGSTTMTSSELQSYTNGTWIKLFSDDGSSAVSTTQPLARASAAFWYDKAHGKFYLFGGKTCVGCQTDNGTGQFLNDFWEYTPPSLSDCKRAYYSSSSEVACTSVGTWKQLYAGTNSHSFSSTPSTADYPPPLMAAAGVFASRAPGDYNHYGDGYYTVSDGACENQGPILGTPATSKERVGAVYIDIDRSQFSSTENLLVNLKMLPFAPSTYTAAGADNGDGTKLAGYHFNGTYGASTSDDRDSASESDKAYIRVTLLVNPVSSVDAMLSQLQPRFRSYQTPGTAQVAHEFDLAASGTGQPTEKQIFIPLSMDSRVNLVKIERVRGTVKFYDMTLTKF